MLQRTRAQPPVEIPGSDGSGQNGVGELVDFALGFLRRQYLIVLILMLLGGAGGVIFLQVTPPTYTAHSKIILAPHRSQFIQQQSIFADAPIDNPQMASQIEVLQSRAIVASVVEKLKLADDPEFVSPPVGLIWRVFQVFTGQSSAEPTLDAPEKAIDPEKAINTAIATLTDRLTVTRVGTSFLIDIGVSSRNPEKSAQIANAVATAYIDDQQEAKHQANLSASTWLQERLQELGTRNAQAERAVLEFKQKNNIIAAAGKRMDEQNLSDLNTRLVAARAHTTDRLARLTRIESIIRTWKANATLDATVSDELSSQILTSLRQQYLDLSRREAEYSARFGRDHLAVVNLRDKMRDLRTSTFDELRRLAETFKSDYEIAKQGQTEIEKQLGQIVSQSQTANQAQVTLRELESTANTYHSLYESFLQRYTAGVQQDSFPLTQTRLISLASTPTSKSKPKSPIVLALSLMGGIALGAGIGFLRELMDRVFRTGAQVQSLLQIPCLALVPLLKESAPTRLRLKEVPAKAFGQRAVAPDSSILWRVVDSPLSPFAESIRSIKLATDLNVTDRPNKVIGFTSALPDEGKSTIAAALAQLTAQVGGRVIIVDCDLRNPSISRRLAPKATVGIVDVISGARSLEETVWKDPTTNLFVLPAVETTPLFHASEVLGAEPTRRLIDKLRASFDVVIIDLPPLAPVVDVRAAAHLVDCMILVIEWGRTKVDVVQHALDTAPNVHEAVIGAVLNKIDMSHMRRYDTRSEGFYNSKYYTKYGYSDGR